MQFCYILLPVAAIPGEEEENKEAALLPLISQQPTNKTPVLLKPSLKILYSVVTSEDQYNIIQDNR